MNEQNYIKAIEELEQKCNDTSFRVIANYMRAYRPGTPDGEKVERLTSSELVVDLEEIADVSVNDVTEVLLTLGYSLHCDKRGEPKWLLRPVAAAPDATILAPYDKQRECFAHKCNLLITFVAHSHQLGMEDSHIIGNGAKRTRHGSYRTVYLDNRGNGKKAYRGEIQRVDTRGVVRLRKWFKSYEEAYEWTMRG